MNQTDTETISPIQKWNFKNGDKMPKKMNNKIDKFHKSQIKKNTRTDNQMKPVKLQELNVILKKPKSHSVSIKSENLKIY